MIASVFSESSPHYRNFTKQYENTGGGEDQVEILKGIFNAAKADFEGGYLFHLEARISGEVYSDFVLLAKAALDQGSKDVAAVLACAALEDSLKRFALSKGLDVADKEMQEVVNALKSVGGLVVRRKTFWDSIPKVRNFAMHASWDKITSQDVGGVIGFVEQFLLVNFS